MSDDAEMQRDSGSEAAGGAARSGAVETVRHKTLEVLRERIRLLGVSRSGAYEHYNLKMEMGFPISVEASVLNFIHAHLPSLRSYHEIGSGFGTLPFMLAFDGLASVGVERDERRHLTATTILRELSAEYPHIESNCRLIGAPFPAAVADLDVSESMAILTDFVATQSPRDYIALCQRLAHYRYVLLDLQRFCEKRDSEGEEDRLVEELKSCGLSRCAQSMDLSSEGHYQLFESTRAGELRQLQVKSAGNERSPNRGDGAVVASTRSSMEVTVAVAATEMVQRESVALLAEASDHSGALSGFVLPPLPSKARHKPFGGWLGLSALLTIGIPALLAIAYFGFIASSQYVTSFQFAVRGPSQAAAGRVVGSASLQGAGAMSPDSFVVTDYINSAQALADVEKVLDVRAMFSRGDIDSWSRLSPDASREELIAYWARMVSARFDLISGNVLVSIHGFAPRDSLTLAETIVTKADEMFRRLNNQAQHDMVRIADDNVGRTQAQLGAATQALVEFRQKSGLVDPTRTAQAGASIVDELRRQLATLRAQSATIEVTTPNSPALAGLNSQIAVIEGQIRKEEALGPSLVQSVSAETLARYQSLEFERQSSERLYTEALSLRKGGGLVRADPDDLMGFLPRTEHEERSGREAMREVATSSSHDVQLHIHHEYFTATTAHTDPAAVEWFASSLGRSLDGSRLELAIKLNREIIARETGRTSERWFFVHGHWALNGSDRTSCTIDNEIALLLRNGCRGDFTFPAGRAHTNPRIKVPYLCRPYEAPKGYDLAEAEPEIACGNAAAARSKFFIWASAATSGQCSLDYMSKSTRHHLNNTEEAARALIDTAYVADGCLYVKTHAHSLHPYYFEYSRAAVFPHQYPAVQVLLSVVFEAAALAGASVDFLSAPQVYDALLTAPQKSALDLVDRYMRSEPGTTALAWTRSISSWLSTAVGLRRRLP